MAEYRGPDPYEGTPTDQGSERLDRMLGQGALQVDSFLPMAIELAALLGTLHRKGIVHKGICPASILWNRSTLRVQLTASEIPEGASQPGKSLEAGFPRASAAPYLSPEQTGRMNRLVDYRTDFYSLGVTFYQMLTGALPFSARDALEWAHCHVARTPPAPSAVAPEVPPGLSNLVMKLLAKPAEERYQTAFGLESDLRRCLAEWSARGAIPSFALGENDLSEEFLIPQHLYGREAEVAALEGAFQEVLETGAPQLVLVTGYSGIGKTALVQELSRPVAAARSSFISGKFNQYQPNIPYPTLVEAFRALIRDVLTESEEQIEKRREQIRRALDGNGQIVAEVLPELSLIIGAQSPVPELPPAASQNRFDLVFRRFLGAVTREHRPLVLFLDDSQWVDAASLRLIEAVMTDPNTRNLLVIAAYRDNEVNATHPLMLAHERILEGPTKVRTLNLAPLSFDAVCRLLADALHADRVRIEPLGKRVYEKCGGNPFFLIQFLTTLRGERLLEFDRERRRWKWSLEGIRAKGFTDNVVAFLTRKLRKLPTTVQGSLGLAACIGHRFDQKMLASIHGVPAEETRAALEKASRDRLVVRLSDDVYDFAHDRVQQAAYSMLGTVERRQAHLRIGRTLLSSCPPEELQERLFEIAEQFEAGLEEITEREEKRRVAAIDVQAAQRAIHSMAYASARQFARGALALLQPEDWGSDYALLRQVYEVLVRAEYLNGSLDRCGELISEALSHLQTDLEKAEFYNLLVVGQTLQGAYENAVESGSKGLALLGMELPTGSCEDAIRAEVEEVDALMGRRAPLELLQAPLLKDPAQRVLRAILNNIGYPAYVTFPALSQWIATRGVVLSLRHGLSKESCQSFAEFGILIGQSLNQCTRAYGFAKLGLKLADRLGAIDIKCKTSCTMAEAVLAWARPLREGLPILSEGIRAGMVTGDLEWVGYSLVAQAHLLYCAGEPLLSVQATLESALEQVAHSGHQGATEILSAQRHVALALQDEGSDAATSKDELDLAAECRRHGNRFALCIHHSHLAERLLYRSEYGTALRHAGEARELTRHFMGPTLRSSATFYHALASLKVLSQGGGGEFASKGDLEGALREDVALLTVWSDSCPANFAHKLLLVQAESARMAGSVREATDRYEAAVSSARESGFIQEQALAAELAAQFYAEQGWERLAGFSLREAHDCYSRWGARSKVKQLEAQHPWLGEPGCPADRRSAASASSALDAIAVVLASQAISREIELPRLLETLMRTVIESAGAQTGYLLFLLENGELEIESMAHVAGQGVQVERLSSKLDPSRMPTSVINYVRRTHESVVLEDALRQYGYAADPYVVRNRPVSVLCLPLLYRGHLVGMLYLENNLIKNAFSAERIAVLDLLASQIAISLENARYYEALRASEQKVRALVETSPIAIGLCDRDQNVRLFNRKFTELFGYTRADVANVEQWWPLAHPDERDREAIRAQWLERFEESSRTQREIVPIEGKIRCKDGTERYVEGHGSFIGDQMFMAFSDLTERRQGELERERLIEEARAANTAKDRFLAVLSHELRNPLAAIHAGVDLLKRTALAREPRARQSLEVIERNTSLQARLVNDLLDLSRLARGKLELKRAPVELEIVVELAVQPFRAEAERSQVALECQAEPGLWVDGDLDRLQQAVMNLVSNALKFTPAGGRVSASVRQAGNKGRIVVEDTGIGIDADRVPTIFEMFHPGEGGVRRAQGLGIGLALVRAIAELHGGSVRAQSAGAGRGSWFELTLPLIEAPRRAAAKIEEASPIDYPSIRVLYVEDNPDTRSLLVDALTMLSYQVVSAESGEEALDLLAHGPVDVILSDIGLPGMDGYEFLRRARAIPATAKIPALAITGYGQARDVLLAREAGFLDHFVKPIDLATLDERIRSLELGRLAGEAR
jgi:PAS domain S-box-containing protein